MKRGYHQHFSTSAKISHSLIYVGQGCAISQMELGVRITTGVEFADQGTSANPIQIQQILPQVRRLISLNDSVGDSWLGARPCLADSLPVIGASKKYKGLWFNFGHGHVGLTAGPSSGKLLAQMISGEKTFCDPVPYSPYRFRKAH